jgi:transketolase
MRSAFITTLIALAERDPRIMLLTADMGYLVVEAFAEKFPTRFINVGVAEQNMIGVATGLAEAGFLPFVYSIAPFAALRPFEFIRNGPVYHRLPVRIVGIGQGVEYGQNGHTHFALDDIGVLRTQPGLTIIAPADDAQTVNALQQTWDIAGPVYYRLSKESSNIPALGGAFALGRAQFIRQGQDALIVSSGAITSAAIRAAELLETQGKQVGVLVVASIVMATTLLVIGNFIADLLLAWSDPRIRLR